MIGRKQAARAGLITLALLLLLSVWGGFNDDKEETEGGESSVVKEADLEREEVTVNHEEESAPAVESSDEVYSEELSFRQVKWLGSVPDVHDEAGVWVYTLENHPGALADKFEWAEEDVLEWQIADEDYFKYKIQTKSLELVDDDTVKIIVEVGDEKIVESQKEQRNQNHLIIEKGALDGKKFLIETADGTVLSLQD